MSIAALPKPDHGVTDVLRDVVDFDPDELVVIAMKGGKMYRCFNSDYNSVKVLGRHRNIEGRASGQVRRELT